MPAMWGFVRNNNSGKIQPSGRDTLDQTCAACVLWSPGLEATLGGGEVHIDDAHDFELNK